MYKMKFRLITCVLFFSLLTVSNLCASDKPVSVDAGLSTGIPLYGDKQIRSINSSFSGEGHRAIFGSVVNLNVKISDNLLFFFGNDLTFDFCWNDEGHSNHLETAFYPGLKVYPGFGGLNFSCAYSAGTRWDFLSSEDELDKTFWGNGFRISAEYNFAWDSEYLLPSVGVYYRFCPRGSYHYDNIIGLYVVMHY